MAGDTVTLMPRRRRICHGGVAYHVLNRGNDRKQLFFKAGDYIAFLALLLEGLKHADVDLIAFCLTPNHWHLVLIPRGSEDLSKYLWWVTNTHAKRYREHYQTRGAGHVYQGRFKSFAVQDDFHLRTLIRYVEANALRARLVERAEDWQWSSIAAMPHEKTRGLLSDWPIDRPPDWLELVNAIAPAAELREIRASIRRERAYGSADWMQQLTARQSVDANTP